MSEHNLKLHSHRINDTAWWYEEPRGIYVIVNPVERGDVPHAELYISWRQIRAALKRLDKRDE